MRTLAILPIKSFEDAKQRLAHELDPGPRRALAEAMFSDVLVALRRATLVDGVLVVTAEAKAQQVAAGYGAAVVGAADRGQNHAAEVGIRQALELGAGRALLVPGDCPLLDPTEVDALLSRVAPERSVLVIPDRHGTGTNALLLTPPDAISPSFGPGSRERHMTIAADASLPAQVAEVHSLSLDVDTPEDLRALQSTLEVTHGGAAHTRGMLRQLVRSRT